jgi:hypothetical protein
MPRHQHWLLTDLSKPDLHYEPLSLDADQWPDVFPSPWRIVRRTLHGGKREGVEVIEVDNGLLSFVVSPTRGMSICRGRFRGWPLGWRAPVQGPVHPAWVNLLDRGGLGWLDGFDEWIVRCGLTSNGPPGEDPVTKEFLPLHGRIANLPASFVEVRVNLEPPFELQIVGKVQEATMFFTNLLLQSTITTLPGSNRVYIDDEITNLLSKPAEVELLYHCNFGPPLLEEGSRVLLPIKELAPRTPRAAEGIATWDRLAGPTPGYAEQVYFVDPLADASGRTLAVLHDAKQARGVALRWQKENLPRFILWKNTVPWDEGYVTGLEPATNYPNFKAVERQQGRVITLAPGQTYRCGFEVEVFDERQPGLKDACAQVAAFQAPAEAIIHPQPVAKWGG